MAEASDPTKPDELECKELCMQNNWSKDPETRLSEALKCLVCLAQKVNKARYAFVHSKDPKDEAALNTAEKALYREISGVSKAPDNGSTLATFAVDLAFERDSKPPNVLYISGVSGYAWTEGETPRLMTYSSMSSSSQTGYPPLSP